MSIDASPVTFALSHRRRFFLVCCALTLVILAPLWRPLGVGLILGYFSEGPLDRLCARFKLADRGRALAAVGLIAGVLMLLLLPAGFAIYRALAELLSSLDLDQLAAPQGQRGSLSEFSASITRWLGERLAAWNLPLSAETLTALRQRLREAGIPLLQAVLSGLRGLLSSTPAALLSALVALVAWWLAAVDGARLRDTALPWLVPYEAPRAILSRAARVVLRGLIVANLAVAAVQAVLCTVGLLLVGIPRALTLGVLTFFLAFVPVVGTGLVTVGSALYLFSQDRIGAGVGMLVLAAVTGTIDNLLRPLFLRGQVELPLAWIFLSIVGGLWGIGLAGVILGPLFACACREAFMLLLAESPASPASPASAAPGDEGSR
jgi:predicted PurR-regulated permease PerM